MSDITFSKHVLSQNTYCFYPDLVMEVGKEVYVDGDKYEATGATFVVECVYSGTTDAGTFTWKIDNNLVNSETENVDIVTRELDYNNERYYSYFKIQINFKIQ